MSTTTANLQRQILVVDDEPVVSALVEDLLVEQGWAVTVAVSGQAALALLGERRFDLVLVERRLPDLDGVALLRQILAVDPAARVVLVGACGSPATALEALRAGAADFVLKPVDDVEVFVERIEQALGRAPRGPEAFAALAPRTLPASAAEALRVLRQALDS